MTRYLFALLQSNGNTIENLRERESYYLYKMNAPITNAMNCFYSTIETTLSTYQYARIVSFIVCTLFKHILSRLGESAGEY